MPYGSPNDPAADLNLIPSQMIERVDVLTGGASAVYGSDAIAGVVNFIMKDDFEGVQIDTQYGFYQHNNDYDTNGVTP
jgi:iron complex outermembrane receptor protein